jgi:hypothetical protein
MQVNRKQEGSNRYGEYKKRHISRCIPANKPHQRIELNDASKLSHSGDVQSEVR